MANNGSQHTVHKVSFSVHPDLEQWLPPQTASQYAGLKERLMEEGCKKDAITVASVNGEKRLADGHNTLTLCIMLKIKPTEPRVLKFDSWDDVKEWMIRNQDARRNWTSEQREQMAKKLHEQGESNRAIADQMGVSEMTIRRDLSGATYVAPGIKNIGKKANLVIGKDGKKYAGTDATLYCERCKRIGTSTPGCNGCKVAREQAKAARKKTKKDKAAQPSELVDAFQNPIPNGLKDVYADGWIQEAIDSLVVMASELRQKKLGNGMQKRAKHFPFFKPDDFISGLATIDQTLDLLIEHLKENRPAGVCPVCLGTKCPKCKQSGLVPRSIYKTLKT